MKSYKIIFITITLIAASATAILFMHACRPATKEKPNIILISVDTLRPDFLGCYGYEKDVSPNVDSFAAESLLFENCLAQAPSTAPSCSSFLSGFLPHETKVPNNSTLVPSGVPMVAKILDENGYRTYGVVSNYVVRKIRGFGQGFDIYNDKMDPVDPWKDADEISVNKYVEFNQNRNDPKDFIKLHNSYRILTDLGFQKKFKEAEKLYEKIILEWPEFYPATFFMGRLYVEQKDFSRAIPYLERVVEFDPNHFDAHRFLGRAYVGVPTSENTYLDKAIKHCKESIRIRPEEQPLYALISKLLERQGKIDEAITYLEELVKLNPEALEALCDLGKLYRSKGNYSKAVECYNRALHYNPQMSKAHHALGIIYFKLNRYNKAISEYKKALEIRPDYPEAHLNLGVALSCQGIFEEAILHYEKALELRPNWHEANINLNLTKKKKAKEKLQRTNEQ